MKLECFFCFFFAERLLFTILSVLLPCGHFAVQESLQLGTVLNNNKSLSDSLSKFVWQIIVLADGKAASCACGKFHLKF